MNPVFSQESFWRLYFALEHEAGSVDDFAAQLGALERDFTVGTQPGVARRRFVEFPFSCGERFSLVITYQSWAGCAYGQNLYLCDDRTQSRSQMGWWDLARWHPYCLRLEEFDLLVEFWQRDPRWEGCNTPLLLLCRFVGLTTEAAGKALAARGQAALQALGLPQTPGRLEVPVYPQDDYRWEIDSELGWTFTSDDCCCYSLRNREHAGSDEGSFRFAGFGERMSDVERWLCRK